MFLSCQQCWRVIWAEKDNNTTQYSHCGTLAECSAAIESGRCSWCDAIAKSILVSGIKLHVFTECISTLQYLQQGNNTPGS